jgi:hypothetical protein
MTDESAPEESAMFRFTIRDVPWLTVVVGMGSCAGPVSAEESGRHAKAPDRAIVRELSKLSGHGYKCEQLVQVVNVLRRMGKDKALTELRRYVDEAMVERHGENAVFLIVRCLFVNEAGWKPPALGLPTPDLPVDTIAKLPEFPLAFSKDVPFFVIDGYYLGGRAEDPRPMLEECKKLPLRDSDLPTKDFMAAAKALIDSKTFADFYPDQNHRAAMAKMIREQAE